MHPVCREARSCLEHTTQANSSDAMRRGRRTRDGAHLKCPSHQLMRKFDSQVAMGFPQDVEHDTAGNRGTERQELQGGLQRGRLEAGAETNSRGADWLQRGRLQRGRPAPEGQTGSRGADRLQRGRPAAEGQTGSRGADRLQRGRPAPEGQTGSRGAGRTEQLKAEGVTDSKGLSLTEWLLVGPLLCIKPWLQTQPNLS